MKINSGLVEYNKRWGAFCTLHWFAAGEQIIASSTAKETLYLYHWYLNIDNKRQTPTKAYP